MRRGGLISLSAYGAAGGLLERVYRPLLNAKADYIRSRPTAFQLVSWDLDMELEHLQFGSPLARCRLHLISGPALPKTPAYLTAKLLDGPSEFFRLTQPEILLRLRKGRYLRMMSET